MESYQFLLVLAIILLSTKVLGLLSERVHMPQVVGALLAGVILGPSVLGMVTETDFLMKVSEIGVIVLMFTAGLDTDIKELKKTGFASFVIAVIGVVVPLACGFGCYMAFFSDTADPANVLKATFIGVVLTATSVSITVETLREMGKLRGKVGTAILGAAVIDDILGLIVLTVISGFADPSVNPASVFIRILLFFVFIAIVGFGAYQVFKKMDKAWGEKRRVAIVGLVFCLILAYISEVVFGIADITGAYFAGLILCNIMRTREYIAKKMTVISYMFFSPLFFASIGIKTVVTGMTGTLVVFSLILLAVAILSKIIGCGLAAKICRFNWGDSLKIGVGMMTRGEVALIVAQKGLDVGVVDSVYFTAVILLIVVSSVATPLVLKALFTKMPPQKHPSQVNG